MFLDVPLCFLYFGKVEDLPHVYNHSLPSWLIVPLKCQIGNTKDIAMFSQGNEEWKVSWGWTGLIFPLPSSL